MSNIPQENITIEVVAIPVEVQEITNAELLAIDFEEDDEAEFVQGLLEIQETLEQVILSDNPEEFLLPRDGREAPIWEMIELVDELKRSRFGDRTLSRMERFARGQQRKKEKLNELEKAENPKYKKCPNCPFYYKGLQSLRNHIGRQICKKISTGLITHPSPKKKKVSDKLYHLVMILENLIVNSNQYKKQIQSQAELQEEDYELCEECGLKPIEWEGRGGYFCSECYDTKPDLCLDCLSQQTGQDEMLTINLIQCGFNENKEPLCMGCWKDRCKKGMEENDENSVEYGVWEDIWFIVRDYFNE